VEKVRVVVGLHLNSTDQAPVLYMDEKSQIQALERTRPVLPMGLSDVEGVTHDYCRHGTTTMFAALDVLDGSVITQCKPRRRHQEYLGFLKHLEAIILRELEVHLIAGNYGTHKHPKVKAWLVRHPHYHMHYTPTYASWLNQVERRFGLITQQANRRGSFLNVKEPGAEDRRLRRPLQSPSPPLHLGRDRGFHPRQTTGLCKVINGPSY
jgi:hypothetical protein